jgi:hypothetical protein
LDGVAERACGRFAHEGEVSGEGAGVDAFVIKLADARGEFDLLVIKPSPETEEVDD